MSQTHLTKQIDSLRNFLSPFLPLANCHMVDFFTKSTFQTLIGHEIQSEIKTIGCQQIIELLFENRLGQAPQLEKFVKNCSNFSLKNRLDLCSDSETFLQKYNINRLKLDIFMTPKKSHEVEILSAISASLSKTLNISHLVDIGDGKGYLSSMLALHHKIPILGVDASNINTNGAIKRAKKLSRVWKGIDKNPRKSVPSKNDETNCSDILLYKQTTQFIDENTNLEALLAEHYEQIPTPMRMGLVGLHTCGNLAPNSLRIFTSNPNIQMICNVGCCYHLLTEKFDDEGYCEPDFTFPLSDYLIKKNISIGRSARMIANQSDDRILANKELPNKTIYYRAMLQVLLEKHCDEMPTKNVGKCRKPCANFKEYASKAIKKLDVDLAVSDDELFEVEEMFRERVDELNVFYLIRSKLSPVIESLILLDRLLFLVEKGFRDSYLIKLFDPVISPRCYGIVAVKESLV